jgi:hypothetical protein
MDEPQTEAEAQAKRILVVEGVVKDITDFLQ